MLLFHSFTLYLKLKDYFRKKRTKSFCIDLLKSNEILRYNDDEYKKLIQSMRGMIDICYEDIDKPVIIDKSRGWIGPNIMRSVSK